MKYDLMHSYLGWTISIGTGSQRFVARRHGVKMCAYTLETLRQMIKQRDTLRAGDVMPGESKDWGLI